jgi:hypothetical protein
VSKFHERVRPHLEALLEPGEDLRGFVAATQQSIFKGRMVAIAVTDRRLIVLPLDRRIEPNGDAISIAPEEIASAKVGGAGGGWAEPTLVVMDSAAARLRIETIGGEKLKLMMMRGAGPGALGELGGGVAQRAGMEALAAWFSGLDDRPTAI